MSAVDSLLEWNRRADEIAEKTGIPKSEVLDRALGLLEWVSSPSNDNPEITTLLNRNQLGEPAFKAFLLSLAKSV